MIYMLKSFGSHLSNSCHEQACNGIFMFIGFSISYCFLLLLQLLVQLKLPFNLRINICYCFLLLLQLLVQLKLPFNLQNNIWYYRAPELIFGATKYTTAINICSRKNA
ncbi:uncharacterized protein [Gossypium hirsutum]|uniref:Uncharacterized protein n=1 Tax=Gossypium hirsutum TaxID=3635 RepID=A0ABM3BWM2_GOSHI|nr:uncharacterized protein LOC107921112 [Gossypium hirsutum]